MLQLRHTSPFRGAALKAGGQDGYEQCRTYRADQILSHPWGQASPPTPSSVPDSSCTASCSPGLPAASSNASCCIPPWQRSCFHSLDVSNIFGMLRFYHGLERATQLPQPFCHWIQLEQPPASTVLSKKREQKTFASLLCSEPTLDLAKKMCWDFRDTTTQHLTSSLSWILEIKYQVVIFFSPSLLCYQCFAFAFQACKRF